MTNLFDLTGKVALVTGANTGLGQAIAVGLAQAGADREEILVVPVDLAQVDTTRTHWPFLRDRRIDAYGNLTKRFVD